MLKSTWDSIWILPKPIKIAITWKLHGKKIQNNSWYSPRCMYLKYKIKFDFLSLFDDSGERKKLKKIRVFSILFELRIENPPSTLNLVRMFLFSCKGVEQVAYRDQRVLNVVWDLCCDHFLYFCLHICLIQQCMNGSSSSTEFTFRIHCFFVSWEKREERTFLDFAFFWESSETFFFCHT